MKNLTHLFFASQGTTTATTSLKRRLTAEHIIIYKALRDNTQGKDIFYMIMTISVASHNLK